jgi:citrate synthase
MRNFYTGFPRDAHPMATLGSVVGALSTFYQDSLDVRDPRQVEVSVHRLMAKLPTIAAYSHKKSCGQPLMYPKNDLGYCENFLHMMFAVPCEEYHVDPDFADALDMLLIVHADHEQNASTSTVRLAGSAESNPFAAVSAGVATLWGKAHGGANEAVIDMLTEIGDAKNIPKFIARAKDKDDNFRLMGFGHRVYKNYDPRAKIIRQACHDLLESMNLNQPMFEVAMELERIALEDDYFISRKLYPNVDFYSGLIYQALGFPVAMFTVLFAIPRTVGWLAHWQELLGDKDQKISRPRQWYTGVDARDYTPLTDR